MKNVLFLSLDGMTDPLGQSQVLPYLVGLSGKGHRIWLISCEKAERFEEGRAKIEMLCEKHGIGWFPQPYLQTPKGVATILQVRRMYREAVDLHAKHSFDFTHCRSYVPALVGLKLKRKKGLPFIFDMRGFWADERVEGGLWDVKKPWYQAAYRFMKEKEKAFLEEAGHIVSLTHVGKEIMEKMGLERLAPISVIPCSVELEMFGEAGGERRGGIKIDEQGIANNEGIKNKKGERLRLGIQSEALVFVYLGSVGSWYLLEEMLRFFQYVRKKRPEAHFLFVSHSSAEMIRGKASEIGLPHGSLTIQSAERQEIPALLSAADIGLFFIKPCFSKQASSPTKLGEMLAMGLPVIANGGVGDLDDFFAKNKVGKLLSDFDEADFEQVNQQIPQMLSWDKGEIRAVAERHFSLAEAVAVYDSIYHQIPSK
jgi:glycosyltransferase involved in cell wall biosynthesis